MVALYLDDNLASPPMARQLQAAGHLIYLPKEHGTAGADDPIHLEMATALGAVLVTKDQSDFKKLHDEWQASGRDHAGIVLCRELEAGRRFSLLERLARLLTSEAAHNNLITLDMFKTEDVGRASVLGLTPHH